MAQNPIASAAEQDRIRIESAYELRYWAAKLRCSVEQLQEAVAAVGTGPGDVSRYLQSRRRYF
jgi:hypothetical protein